jgi:hypothetical protein
MAQTILVFTLALPVVVLFVLVAAPGHMGGGLEPPWYSAAAPLVGVALYLVGLGWMIWIYRSRPESSRTSWRYRGLAEVPIPTWSTNGRTPHAPPNSATALRDAPGVMREDVARAQAKARAMIWLGVMATLLNAFHWVATPGPRGGMFYEPLWLEVWLGPMGIVGQMVALGWMIRIYRSRPESSDATWRYRDV